MQIKGWRVYIYMNEGNEPPHVHVAKGEALGKFWLVPEEANISEAYAYNFTPAQKREIREILLQHYDLIKQVWEIR